MPMPAPVSRLAPKPSHDVVSLRFPNHPLADVDLSSGFTVLSDGPVEASQWRPLSQQGLLAAVSTVALARSA